MMLLGYAIVLYVGIGLLVAAAFVSIGVTRMMPHTAFTPGARLLLIPGAAALWPYVLARWRNARAPR